MRWPTYPSRPDRPRNRPPRLSDPGDSPAERRWTGRSAADRLWGSADGRTQRGPMSRSDTRSGTARRKSAGGWAEDPELFEKTFPMDLRPQAHDIIRTWLFDTVLRSELEHRQLPWTNAAISGWVLDPDRKKMSKSKGNVVTPLGLLEEHGSDGVRYWAASGRPGTDTTFDANQMRVGRRLAIKILNASRFALGTVEPRGPIAMPVDRAMVRSLAALVGE